MNRFLFVLLFVGGCQIELPDACTILAGTTLCADSGVDSDSGGAGMAHHGGHGGTSVPAGTGGAGEAGAAGAAGTGGHHDAGASGAGTGGVGGGSHGGHGGLEVKLPLPAARPGSKTFDVRFTGEMPAPDAGGIGAARTVCEFSHVNFDDSIVYPGQFGKSHAHVYVGADKSDANGIGAGAGGTCRGGTANLSSYWFPALLRPDGSVIVPIEAHIYLKNSNYDTEGPVEHLPKGLKVVVGDMLATGPQNEFYLHWSCVDNGSIQSATIPDCGGGPVSFDAHFPQCWTGQLDSPDHKSHMSYPVNGRCPTSHPRKIPAYSFHIRYANVPRGSNLSCGNQYCIHADLVTGWDEDIVNTMVDRCVNTGLSCGSHMVGDGRVLD